jgi:hypothetical protein
VALTTHTHTTHTLTYPLVGPPDRPGGTLARHGRRLLLLVRDTRLQDPLPVALLRLRHYPTHRALNTFVLRVPAPLSPAATAAFDRTSLYSWSCLRGACLLHSHRGQYHYSAINAQVIMALPMVPASQVCAPVQCNVG